MKFFICIFLSCCSIISLHAQNLSYHKNYKSFIPKGWKEHSKVVGDLNNDKVNDMVLVIEEVNSANIILNESLGKDTLNTNPRTLLILFGDKNKGYRLETSNPHFLPSEDDAESTCLADPLSEGGVSIEKGLIKINLHYWLSCGSWYVTNYTYTFRYQNGKFELIGLDCYSFHRASGASNTTSINFSTKKKQVITGTNEFKEGKPKEKWSAIKTGKLFNLAQISTDDVLDLVQL